MTGDVGERPVTWRSDPGEFVRRHLRVSPVTEVPEIRLHQAEEPIGLWLLTEAMLSLHCHNGPRPSECPFRDEDDDVDTGEICTDCGKGGVVRPGEQGQDEEHS
jgi:Predicted methyltransferase